MLKSNTFQQISWKYYDLKASFVGNKEDKILKLFLMLSKFINFDIFLSLLVSIQQLFTAVLWFMILLQLVYRFSYVKFVH